MPQEKYNPTSDDIAKAEEAMDSKQRVDSSVRENLVQEARGELDVMTFQEIFNSFNIEEGNEEYDRFSCKIRGYTMSGVINKDINHSIESLAVDGYDIPKDSKELKDLLSKYGYTLHELSRVTKRKVDERALHKGILDLLK